MSGMVALQEGEPEAKYEATKIQPHQPWGPIMAILKMPRLLPQHLSLTNALLCRRNAFHFWKHGDWNNRTNSNTSSFEASLPRVGVEKRFGEMRYLLGSSPRKRDHYQKRGLMAVKGKNEWGRLTPGALEKWISAGGTWNSGTLGHLGDRRWNFRGALQVQTTGLPSQLLTLFGWGWLPMLCFCIIEKRMRWYRVSFLSDRKGIVCGENTDVQGCYLPSCSWCLLKRVRRS